jgi:lysozyme
MNIDIVKATLTKDEARRTRLYNDVDGKTHQSAVGKLTIGVGYNIEDRGLPNQVIDLLLDLSVAECVHDLTASFPWFSTLDEVRQHVMLNMRFQLGPVRFDRTA